MNQKQAVHNPYLKNRHPEPPNAMEHNYIAPSNNSGSSNQGTGMTPKMSSMSLDIDNSNNTKMNVTKPNHLFSKDEVSEITFA